METLHSSTPAAEGPRSVGTFICYRRDDASFAAGWLHRLLDAKSYADRHGATCKLDVFFDQAEPGVANWKAHLMPSLQSSRAFIVVCSHGLATNFSKGETVDWAHLEIDWWMNHRGAPPILIDLTGNDRWIPERIRQRWPALNRLVINPDELKRNLDDPDGEFGTRVRKWIVDTIVESEHATTHEELARSRRTIVKLRVASVAAGLACIAASLGWYRAYQAQKVAETQREVSRSSVGFMSQLFSRVDPDGLFGESSTAQELLKAAPSTLANDSSPIFKAHLLRIVGGVYTGLSNSDEAIDLLTKADQIMAESNAEAEDRFRTAYSLGEAYLYAEDITPALPHLERALALAASPGVSNAERAYTSMLLGDYHAWSEPPDREKAEGYYKDALALDVEDSVVAAARDYNRLGNLALEDDRKAEAQEYFGKAANAAKNFPEGTNPLFKGQYDHDFAAALYEDGNFDEALRQFSTSSESFRNAYGDDSIEFGIAENNVGRMLLELDRVEESAARISTAVRVETAARGPQFNGLAMALNTHALTLRATGKATEAAAQFTKALEVAQANDSGVAAQILVHMAEDDLLANDIPAAKKRLDMAKSVFERKDAAAGWRYALYQSAMAELLLRECQLVEARTYLERSGTVLNRRWPNGNVFTRNAAARQQSLEKNSGCAGDTTKA